MTYANRVNSAPTGPARVPRPVVALGALGAVPFLSFAAAVPFLEADILSSARYILCGYGAVILSFLGGIHWGLVVADSHQANIGTSESLWLIAGVVPALVGWVSLIISGPSGLIILALAFLGMFLFDCQAARHGLAPVWYPVLRRYLSIVVIAALIFAALP